MKELAGSVRQELNMEKIYKEYIDFTTNIKTATLDRRPDKRYTHYLNAIKYASSLLKEYADLDNKYDLILSAAKDAVEIVQEQKKYIAYLENKIKEIKGEQENVQSDYSATQKKQPGRNDIRRTETNVMRKKLRQR